MKYFILLLTFALCFFSCKKDLTCEDFKEGTFLVISNDSKIEPYTIERKNNIQTEYKNNGEASIVTLNWSDNCDYNMMFSTDGQETSDLAFIVNLKGGMNVKFNKISGDSLFFEASFVTDNIDFSDSGKLVKIK